MLTLETFHALLTPEGQAALAAAAALDVDETTLLPALTRLRRHVPAALAAAALETTLLRRRARTKFRQADALYFTREALEQASGELVARHRAQRFRVQADTVYDLCCGIGGDALALAAAGLQVVGYDRDPLRVAIAQANAAALGLAQRACFLVGDVRELVPPPGAWIFFDPARRDADGRRRAPAAYQPPLATIERWFDRAAGLAVKVAPGIDYEALPYPVEVEIVSLGGEVKEACLWWGALRRHGRSATLLPAGVTLTDEAAPPPPLSAPQRYLYEPDGAVIRAHLIAQLAHRLGAAQIDTTLAFLTAAHLTPTPFARAWEILETIPFNLKQLRARLRRLGVGRVVIKKRGSPIDPQVLERQLRLEGPEALTLVLTRVQGEHVALLCREVQAGG